MTDLHKGGTMAQNQPMIHTRRLTLRPFTLDDLYTTHAYAGNAENTQYMLHLPNEGLQDTQRFLQRVVAEWAKDQPAFYEYAVVLQGKHIGAVSVSLDESRQQAELGWIIHKLYQGKGYATEAAGAMLRFAIDSLKVKKVVAHCDGRNEPSAHVMGKIGLSLESADGTRRYAGSDVDIQELMYALTV